MEKSLIVMRKNDFVSILVSGFVIQSRPENSMVCPSYHMGLTRFDGIKEELPTAFKGYDKLIFLGFTPPKFLQEKLNEHNVPFEIISNNSLEVIVENHPLKITLKNLLDKNTLAFKIISNVIPTLCHNHELLSLPNFLTIWRNFIRSEEEFARMEPLLNLLVEGMTND